ncbi:transglycosylase-like protein with SLT domain [Phyllobacterium myrsinacearum]|uniref:lytic transglycosylase domain-containing protein n=1 Tax=Phyllobacterium myrsinacearum TaxID=28101 RepID=UPI001029152E|nr:lytic transglycosylase domain-containing protein [Phyllobacterium myrsinacearum]RZS87850.1 transglycosylase-like protein with SLT domain [Phyllobacterium myrsinacearum]
MNGVANRSGSAATVDAGRSARTDHRPVWILIGLCLLGLTVPEAARAVEANDPGMPPVKIMASGGRATTPPSAVDAAACQFTRVPSAEDGKALVQRIAREEHADVALAVAVARRESGFHMDSISSAGAVGLMQLMPATARRFEVDICDPEDNVRGGVRYLKFLEGKYANPLYVLAAYNAGEAAVEQNGGIPFYPATVRYIAAVLSDVYDWRPFDDRKMPGKVVHQGRKAPDKSDAGNAGAWTQGFVLHVE